MTKEKPTRASQTKSDSTKVETKAKTVAPKVKPKVDLQPPKEDLQPSVEKWQAEAAKLLCKKEFPAAGPCYVCQNCCQSCAVLMCRTCHAFMCQDCFEMAHSAPMFRMHQVVSHSHTMHTCAELRISGA